MQQQHTAADLIVVGKHPASLLSDLVFERGPSHPAPRAHRCAGGAAWLPARHQRGARTAPGHRPAYAPREGRQPRLPAIPTRRRRSGDPDLFVILPLPCGQSDAWGHSQPLPASQPSGRPRQGLDRRGQRHGRLVVAVPGAVAGANRGKAFVWAPFCKPTAAGAAQRAVGGFVDQWR